MQKSMRRSIRDKLYISTVAGDACQQARANRLGLEIAEFCTAMNLDGELFGQYDAIAREKMRSASRFVLHAPFVELAPCAIDPRVRQVTRERYLQAIHLAAGYGIHRIVVHSGFNPYIYYPQWFVPESVKFWREFLPQLPPDTEILLENVFETDPRLPFRVVDETADPRLRLCLDVGHVNAYDRAYTVLEWLNYFRPYLRHIHLHNNDAVTDLHLPLGDGVIDMEAVLDWVQLNAPGATITLESTDSGESVRWLREKGYL